MIHPKLRILLVILIIFFFHFHKKVRDIFRHNSLGARVNLVVSKLMILTGEEVQTKGFFLPFDSFQDISVILLDCLPLGIVSSACDILLSTLDEIKDWFVGVIVRILYLQANLFVSYNADKTMKSFCQWQSDEYFRGGTNHDVALLLTRFPNT